MEQEKIDKVLALTDKRYTAKHDYEALIGVIDELKGHNYSSKDLVLEFFENWNRLYSTTRVMSRLDSGDIEHFYKKVFDTIEQEWRLICEKRLAVVEQIDEKLAKL